MSACVTIPPVTGPFAGMTLDQLQAARSAAQTALIALISGGKPQTVSYGQGDGTKMVTYTKANEGSLRQLIRELNAAMGLGGRRAIGVVFA